MKVHVLVAFLLVAVIGITANTVNTVEMIDTTDTTITPTTTITSTTTITPTTDIFDDGLEDDCAPILTFPEVGDRAERHRTVKCESLFVEGFIGAAACFRDCLTMGQATGSCKDGVCFCSRITFNELWTKRFRARLERLFPLHQ